MSGHSKWSPIKRQKGVNDVKRGAVFTKVAREIGMAARAGGGDPDGNFRLRLAIEKARAVNMPADNIKRAIERATGAGEAEQYEEIVYEGYGPGGVALLVEAATDNRNRTAAEVRSRFAKSGGALAASGAVAWQFEVRGRHHRPARRASIPTRSPWRPSTPAPRTWTPTPTRSRSTPRRPTSRACASGSRRPASPIDEAESAMIAKQTVELDSGRARQALRLIEELEDIDDVQRVTANFDIPEEIFAEVAG